MNGQASRRPGSAFQVLWQLRKQEIEDTGTFSGWGNGRLRGRASEFGLTDYELAETLVDFVIANKRGMLGYDYAVLSYIAERNGGTANVVPKKHQGKPYQALEIPSLSESTIAMLVAESAGSTISWDACLRAFDDAFRHWSDEVPVLLQRWAADALSGRVPRPVAKTGADPNTRASRDGAIVLAVRMALESGAFRGATHSPQSKAPDPACGGKARSACELVAVKLERANWGVILSYEGVRDIWKRRGGN